MKELEKSWEEEKVVREEAGGKEAEQGRYRGL